METIANRIKQALEIRDMKQSDLVKKTGIGKSSISTYISGAYEPKQRNIYKIAEALDVNEAWLMGYDIPMERKEKKASEIKSTSSSNVISEKDEKKIQKDLKKFMDELKSGQDGPAFYNGVELSDHDLQVLEEGMEFILRSLKIENKKKYTPKKYRK